ncbi:MAG: hypothetical protein QOJ42_2515 [Acidobacteriaceae bacterium]|nr:hypothetical protein [Acidobacteriaceae bacterium]
MKKLVAAAVASVFAIAVSSFAAGYEHKAPVHQTVVKESQATQKATVHKVHYGKKIHRRHHRRHHHRPF